MLIGTEKNPKGPNFRKARLIEKDLAGTLLSFLTPPHKDPFSNLENWEKEPSSVDIFDSAQYKPRKIANEKTEEQLRWLRAYSTRWEFRGLPLLHGYCGHMNYLVDVNSVADLPINESLFDNRVLAREVYRDFDLTELQDMHEGHSDDPFDITSYRWPSYLGPINCQWLAQGGADWLYFEEQPLADDIEVVGWHTAIDDKHYLSCRFVIVRSARNAGNPYRIEQHVSRDNFVFLMHQIMGSLNLQLSPKATVRRMQVQTRPGASDKPVLACTPTQVEVAKHVLYMWSARGYREEGKDKNGDHRAAPEDVAAFIDERVKPRPLPNSYPPGEALKLSPQPTSKENQATQTCAK